MLARDKIAVFTEILSCQVVDGNFSSISDSALHIQRPLPVVVLKRRPLYTPCPRYGSSVVGICLTKSPLYDFELTERGAFFEAHHLIKSHSIVSSSFREPAHTKYDAVENCSEVP